MPTDHKADIKQLETRVKSVSNALTKLSKVEDYKELILILKRPGWTTPAEYLFASGIIDSMLDHTMALAKLKDQLIKGSKAVGLRK